MEHHSSSARAVYCVVHDQLHIAAGLQQQAAARGFLRACVSQFDTAVHVEGSGCIGLSCHCRAANALVSSRAAPVRRCGQRLSVSRTTHAAADDVRCATRPPHSALAAARQAPPLPACRAYENPKTLTRTMHAMPYLSGPCGPQGKTHVACKGRPCIAWTDRMTHAAFSSERMRLSSCLPIPCTSQTA